MINGLINCAAWLTLFAVTHAPVVMMAMLTFALIVLISAGLGLILQTLRHWASESYLNARRASRKSPRGRT